jgi:adenine phosphoribosyltransferase
MDLKSYIRSIPDFPRPGIDFKDITTLLKEGDAYKYTIDLWVKRIEHLAIDVVAGPEARGFVFGGPIAYALGAGFVPIRKSGKLPGETVESSYDLEYGSDSLAVHQDAIMPGQRVLLVDDLLATGGTMSTSIELIEKLGGQVVGASFLIELANLRGRERLQPTDVYSLITYENE